MSLDVQVLNYLVLCLIISPFTGLLVYSLQRLINTKIYDSRLNANVEDLVA